MKISRTRSGSWPGLKLDGDETFVVDLRNSLTPIVGGGLTVTRNDTASHCFDYQGNLVNVAANEGRIQGARHLTPNWSRRHANNNSINPDTAKGALVGKAAENAVHYFDDIDDAWWTSLGKKATSNTGTSIAGRAAMGYVGDGNDTTHNVSLSFTTPPAGDYILSGLFAAAANDFVRFSALEYSTFNVAEVYFNVATGAITQENDGAGAAVTVVDSTITKVNGGYWCTATFNKAGAAGNLVAGFASADTNNDSTYIGDNSTTDTWMCALQIEYDVTETLIPSMPILDTEGAASSSVNEIIEYTPVYTETGSVVGEFYLQDDSTISSDPRSIYTFQTHDEDTLNSTRVHLATTGKLQFVMFPNAGALSATIYETTSALSIGWHRFAVSWTSGEVNFYVDGAEENNAFAGLDALIVPTASLMDKFYLGSRSSSDVSSHQDQFFNSPTSYLKVYDRALTAAELKARSL